MRRLALLCLLALVFVAPASAYDRDPELDEIATSLANGRRVSVRCLSPEEAEADMSIALGAAAYVEGRYDDRGRWHPYPYTVFDYGICEPLSALARARDLSDETVPDIAWALLVFIHEAGHLRGHRWSASEALTQRWALRHYRAVAISYFGTTSEVASLLLRYAVYEHREMDLSYRPLGCRWPSVDDAGLLRGCR